MVATHRQTGADITIVTHSIAEKDAGRRGLLRVNPDTGGRRPACCCLALPRMPHACGPSTIGAATLVTHMSAQCLRPARCATAVRADTQMRSASHIASA